MQYKHPFINKKNRISSERENIFETDEDREAFIEFIETLAAVSYENFDELPMNQTFNIQSRDYIELLWNLSIPFEPEINSGITDRMHLDKTITEMGICYAVNSKLAFHNSLRSEEIKQFPFK